jgi:hypothetical protein
MAAKQLSETFLDKLKEQSFTIILLVGIMYYQNLMFTRQLEEYKKMIEAKENLVLKLTDDERIRLIEREKYLVQQRDGFLQDLREEVKSRR